MAKTVRIQITAAICFEYDQRCVYPEVPSGIGTFDVPVEVARDMMEDALYYSELDPREDFISARLIRAYRLHAERLRIALEGVV